MTNVGAMYGNDWTKRILIALVPASKELAQTSYFMATNSLHLTTMCLRYPPTIVACVCIHLACKWSKYEIPISGEVLHCFVFSVIARLSSTCRSHYRGRLGILTSTRMQIWTRLRS